MNCDLVVLGGTPSGLTTAIRAAREGLDVVIVSRYPHLGGLLSNGLGSWDAMYEGNRSAIVQEFLDKVLDHYISTYGKESKEVHDFYYGPLSAGPYTHLTFEPSVVERAFEQLLAAESRIMVLRGFDVVEVLRVKNRLVGVVAEKVGGDETCMVRADAFADATYEGDLAALAGVAYRIGREGRDEFNEQHAGKLFVTRSGPESHHPEGDDLDKLRFPRKSRAHKLNLRPFWGTQREIFSESTGEGDANVQAYNFRVTLTKDPANRIPIEKPEGYDRERFLPITRMQTEFEEPVPYPIKTDLLIAPLKGLPNKIPVPNNKLDWNAAAIPGSVNDYPDGDWETRDRIIKEHKDYALGLLYFLQHDEAIPEAVRQACLEWGLPKDEYTDNGNFPYEVYVREARRIIGRKIFTENDARIGRGLERAPVHEDAIAITDWILDSHDCTTDRVMGSFGDGFTSLSEVTRPAQVPYATLLPKDIDNLLVPVCMSSTHVGWGALRMEPCWMHVGEVAGHAAALAKKLGVAPADLDVGALQRKLVENKVMIAFFNEFDMSSQEPWVPAIQYLGAKGFFREYDAKPAEMLDIATARIWALAVGAIIDGTLDVNAVARSLPATPEGTISAGELRKLVEHELAYRQRTAAKLDAAFSRTGLDAAAPITRSRAAMALYDALAVLDAH